jgi:hypothetical protein
MGAEANTVYGTRMAADVEKGYSESRPTTNEAGTA